MEERRQQKVEEGKVVVLEFAVTLEDELVASSDEDGVLEFVLGQGDVFPAIESAVRGLSVGEASEIILAPEDAYGAYDPELLETLTRDLFPVGVEIVEGLEVELTDQDSGEEFDAVVTEVEGDSVMVDLNHPLAGETLTMRFRIVDVHSPANDEDYEGADSSLYLDMPDQRDGTN